NEDAEEDEDEEIGPGCYVLGLGIPRIGRSKLWRIRKGYIRLYKVLRSHHRITRALISSSLRDPAVKIYWLKRKSYRILYALCRRLAEGKPIMWYRDTTLFLFVSEDVYCARGRTFSTTFETRVWTSVDSGSEEDGVLPHFCARHQTPCYILFLSSIGSTTLSRLAIMNPWTRGEISQAAVIHRLKADNPGLDDMYYRFGPTLRICFDFLEDGALLAVCKARYEDALGRLSLEMLDQMI
ncbi:hypothetical protein BJY52DRAFT_1079998, partial [Lactarius psammicola]